MGSEPEGGHKTMRAFYLIALTGTLLFQLGAANVRAQPESAASSKKIEAEIRAIDDLERQAVLRKDAKTLKARFWSPRMIVNTPANRVGTVDVTLQQLLAGRIDYASFTRNVENITLSGDLAILMGEEILRPQGATDNAGKTVTRRFTNVWRRSGKAWRLIARQSTIIKVE